MTATYEIFDTTVLQGIARKHAKPLQDLAAIEEQLNRRFVAMDRPILALILAVLSGESLLYIGPPGTAKSRLIRAFCVLAGVLADEDGGSATRGDERYFEYLLTPFTEPGELFGYYDIAKLTAAQTLQRDEKGMMQNAEIVYLDEVFNASSAILNSILAFMNEGIFHDRGSRKPVKLKNMFGASNLVPHAAELRAVYDRFVIRSWVDNVEPDGRAVHQLLNAAWRETYSQRNGRTVYASLLAQMQHLQNDIKGLTSSGRLQLANIGGLGGRDFYDVLSARVAYIREADEFAFSNRRLVKMLHIMLLHTLYRMVNAQDKSPHFTDAEMNLFPYFLNERPDEEIGGMLEDLRGR